MQDDKYVVRCEQLHLKNRIRQWCYISQTVASEQFSFSCIQNRGVHTTQLLVVEIGQFQPWSRDDRASTEPQHASLLTIPKVLIEINRCHSTYLVTVCLIYGAKMPSDIFNTDVIPNNISKMKDYPIVLHGIEQNLVSHMAGHQGLFPKKARTSRKKIDSTERNYPIFVRKIKWHIYLEFGKTTSN